MLEARWITNTYSIEYNTGFADVVIENKNNVEIHDTSLLPNTPIKEGYIFKGWKYDDQEVTDTTNLDSIVEEEENGQIFIFKAIWEKEIYDVTYTFVGDSPMDDLEVIKVAYKDILEHQN